MTEPRPVLLAHRSGEPFDFGTHANDFLLRREQAIATETFLVRVPGLGAVPEHVHPDMEQTFLFLSGVGEASLGRDGHERVRHVCMPGDMLFVPAGWHHTVVAQTIEGVSYLTVNAFLPDVHRLGDSAVAHAEMAQSGFDARAADGRCHDAPSPADRVAVFRTAECAFKPDEDAKQAWPLDFAALATTLTGDPSTYRVRRLGPFEYAKAVEPVPRSLTEDLADELFDAAGALPLFVEGSQSPIAVKQPCAESDLDVLIAVRSADQLDQADGIVDRLHGVERHVPMPLSVGVVHEDWLQLPNFYTALSLDPTSPDRRFWRASEAERIAEATRRIVDGLSLVNDLPAMRDMLERSLALAGEPDARVDEWRVIPRWRGLR